MVREAVAADRFYPADPVTLKTTVKGLLSATRGASDAAAVIAPHAGYIYSGPVAGSVFGQVTIPADVILIGPNHTGLGNRASVMGSGKWRIPTGEVGINEELARSVLDSCPIFSNDDSAHRMEHSIEVELPFIHYLNSRSRIVPIALMRMDHNECSELGTALAGVIREYPNKVLIVASSDMNHYESDKVTRAKDKLAIERALELDAEGLLDVTRDKGITMCGVVPAAVALVAARQLGAKGARLSSYSTSAEASGDYSHVVGYAGIVIK